MERTFVFRTKNFALRLYHLLRDLDPARWNPLSWNRSRKEALQERIHALESEVFQLYEKMHGLTGELKLEPSDNSFSATALRSTLGHVGKLLSELKGIEIDDHLSYLALYKLRKKLQKAYQELCVAMELLQEPIPHIRPSNLKRSLVHMGCAVAILAMIETVPDFSWMFWIALAYFCFCWLMEGLKRLHPRLKAKVMKFFAPIAHPHEYDKINSATWYGVALLLLSLTNPTVGTIGVTVLGVADPVAAAVGRSIGKIPMPGNRSLEGSLAFLISGTLATTLMLSWLHPLGNLWRTLVVAGTASLFGAVGEYAGKYPDDNLTIPISSALGAFLSLSLF